MTKMESPAARWRGRALFLRSRLKVHSAAMRVEPALFLGDQRMFKICLAGGAVLAGLLLAASHAQASVVRAWVSGHGSDVAGCGAPTNACRTLQYAHDNIVSFGGEIDILDPAGYGTLNITKAISIVNDGVGTAGVQTNSGNAITINAGTQGAVYLRGLNIDGLQTPGIAGIEFKSGTTLTVVNCVIRHFGGRRHPDRSGVGERVRQDL
jgi:hypothetical protein